MGVARPNPYPAYFPRFRNPRYNFWGHKFTHCAPDIKKVFDSVARSCMGSGNNGNGSSGDGGQNQEAAGNSGVR
jgi:CCR4-NOT transcription complex subunit 1